MGVGGQCHAPAALPPEKTRYPLYRRLGGLQCQSGWVRKISPSPGFDLRTVQPFKHEVLFFIYETLQYYLPVGGKALPCLLDSWLVSCSAGSEHCRQLSRGPSRTFCLAVGPLADSHQLRHILCNCLTHLAGPCIVLCMQNLRK